MPNFNSIANQLVTDMVALNVISINTTEDKMQDFINGTTELITTGLITPLKDELPEEQSNPLYHN